MTHLEIFTRLAQIVGRMALAIETGRAIPAQARMMVREIREIADELERRLK